MSPSPLCDHGQLTLRLSRAWKPERSGGGKASAAAGCSARPPRHVRLPPVCPARLLDHLVRPEQDLRGNREAKGLGGLEVDHELKPPGALDGQVARLGPLEDF